MESQVLLGDCLEVMNDIPDGSVDMILSDLPYGTTNCRWDVIIPLEPLWEQYRRVLKYNGAIVLTASQPFTSVLVASNLKDYRYNWVWEKSKATGYLNSKRMPMKAHEDICVFYRKLPTYNPQMVAGTPYDKGKAHRPTSVYGAQGQKRNTRRRKDLLELEEAELHTLLEKNSLSVTGTKEEQAERYIRLLNPIEVHVKNTTGLRYPRTVQYFKTAESEGKVFHPTQKPISLFEYFIRTYTNENEIVLDTCAGVGTAALAALNSNRKYICIEKNETYYNIMNERISERIENDFTISHVARK